MVQVHNGERRDGCSYLVRLPGADGWHRAEFCNGHWVWGRNAIRASDIMEWFGPLLDDEPALPRSFDRVDEAALVEQGMTPGMVVSSLTQEEREAVLTAGPPRGFVLERSALEAASFLSASSLPINPEPQEGLDYWVWVKAGCREEWVPARHGLGVWWLAGEVRHTADAVKFWRGPMVPPEAPTPAQVAAALGRKRLVHEVHDLEASG